MHHGLIQHKMSLTDWAKGQYKQKQLDKFNATGRIFRIVPDGATPVGRPHLSAATTSQLVMQLKHPNAWWRETAQRLLVERNDPAAVAPLKKFALHDPQPFHRVIGLWTLDGMGRLDDAILRVALKDADPKVRANAIRLSEWRVNKKESTLGKDVFPLAADADPEVRLQFVLSFSDYDGEAVAPILRDVGDNRNLREAAASGLAGREVEFLSARIADAGWLQPSKAREAVFSDIARSVFRRGKPNEVTDLVALIGQLSADRHWQQAAMLAALPPKMEDEYGAAKLIPLPARPQGIDRLAASSDPEIAHAAAGVAALFDWPGKPATTRPVVPLTPRQQELFEIGRQQYTLVCAQCHKPDGLGQEGKAPPLLNSRWVLGPDKRLGRIVLHGLRGPIDIDGKTWNLDMPSLKALSDDQIAGVLTYIRRNWGHSAPPVDPTTIATIREWQEARRDGWTVPELLQVK
jgi:mono/diheme cytochrome c family protein